MKHTALFILLVAAMPTTAATIDCASVPGLAVDADGAPGSYRVDCKGLSFTCDGVFAVANGVAHTQKNDPQHWQTLCTQHWNEAQRTGDFSQVKIVGFLAADGRPVVQSEGDPLPGEAYVTTTSLTIPGTPDRAQRHYVDAGEIPYVVLSPAFATRHGLRLGDLVAVYRAKTGAVAYGVYADCCSVGEASVRLHQDLGADPIVVTADGTRRAKRGLADRVELVALTGAHTQPTLDAAAWRAEITAKGDSAVRALGGIAAIKACAARPG